jgi:hypothetical protein
VTAGETRADAQKQAGRQASTYPLTCAATPWDGNMAICDAVKL